MEKIITNPAMNSLGNLPEHLWGVSAVIAMIGLGTLIAILVLWSLIWKGLALWRAARNGAKIWFIVMLVVNTLGLLEIIYYFYASKKSWGKK